MTLLIKNGRVIDPVNKIDEKLDILIEGPYIKKISGSITGKANEIFDAKNMIVTPGLIDMHTHLREPGQEQKEKIATGTASAAMGGFTSIVCMANTDPPIDSPSQVKLINFITEKEGVVKVLPVAAVTKGMKGEELTEIGDLYENGVVALSDDGYPIMNTELMRRAMEYSTMFDLPILDHCEDLTLSVDGEVNEGYYSTIKGFKGIPDIAETVMVARDLLLAQFTGARLHIQHASAKKSVEYIEYAKAQGTRVTAEVTPHHFSL
ncbi:MAG: dihydroorotase, partial [Spirochaetes bacterium]|nr:dihydroorotase [Spirochaetota bacterium]